MAALGHHEVPVIRLIEHEGRHERLIAQRGTGESQAMYRFDIHLHGDDETVFFDV